MRTRLLAAAVLAGIAGLAGCGSPALKEAGESCSASSECAAGLVCDHGQNPAVCAGNLSIDAAEIDAPDAPPVDAAPIDAPEIDARPVDARVIDAPTDAPADAPTDADPDAPPDA